MSAWHADHERAAAALALVTALPAHALVEAYAVLTRLPGGLAVPAPLAAEALCRRFPDPPLAVADRGALLGTLAAAGVRGGATYDGLAGLEAHAHQEVLLTLDRRAVATYQRLGVRFAAVA